MKIRNFRCVLCKKEYKPSEIQYTCPKCGSLGVLEVNYDYKSFQQKEQEIPLSLPIRNIEDSMWEFAAFLPIDDSKNIPPLKVGGTPLYRNKTLSRELQIKDLYIKD
ncbi:unnamed protein product, partial [marine sediment metagenome]